MVDEKLRQVALQAVGMGLAFGVGILLGQRACAPEPEVIEREVEGPEKVVERCPDAGTPDAGETDAGPAPEVPAADPEPARQMPDAGGPDPAEQRRELLKWAQGKSDGLIGCRRQAPDMHSVIVTLHLDDEAAIEDVDVTAPDDEEISARALTCLSDRIEQWEPPADLVDERRRIVFRLDL